MRADAVVISVSRYSMVDKDTGVLNEATNVRYAIASNLLPFADENLKGYKLVKARLDYTDFQNFPEAPAVYEADINFSISSDGNAKAVASNFVFKESLFPAGKAGK